MDSVVGAGPHQFLLYFLIFNFSVFGRKEPFGGQDVLPEDCRVVGMGLPFNVWAAPTTFSLAEPGFGESVFLL